MRAKEKNSFSMQSNLGSYQLKTGYMIFYVNSIVITKKKPRVDTGKEEERKQSIMP